MANSVPIDTRELTVTPVFKYETREDVAASEREGRAIMITEQVVEVRLAGNNYYAPQFPVHAMWKREGHKVITYAERWAEQFNDFLNGNEQKAAGTPLEMLKPYGITDAQLSLCRALKCYSIEAMDALEGQNLKNFQMNANPLKEMARRYLADRTKGDTANSEIEDLKAQIAALREAMTLKEQVPPEAVVEIVQAANAEFEAKSDAELKAYIKDKTGQAPRGTPSRDWLVNTAKELAA